MGTGHAHHLLHWPNFIPEADVELRRQITEYNRQMKTHIHGKEQFTK